jgi:hypothetical protein
MPPPDIPLYEEDAAPPPYISQQHSTPAAAESPIFDSAEWINTGKSKLPTATQCTAHLKLLHAFARLRSDVGNYESLYGTSIEQEETAGVAANEGGQEAGSLAERLREKRWTIFVTKAVDRFEKWWESLPSESDVVGTPLQTTHFDSAGSYGSDYVQNWTAVGVGMDACFHECLPPLC